MNICIEDFFDLKETIASELFAGLLYPWEALPLIRDFIVRLGKTLDPARFEKRGETVWIAKSAKVFDSAYLGDHIIIDEEAEVRHCAFLRGNAIVGKKATVGNSTELKNVILFNCVEVPHYNYVGDSILGFHAHMGAGSITSNVKADRTNVIVKGADWEIETGLRKFGAMLGDWAEIGCNAVLNPGTVIGPHTNVYPTVSVRGVIPAHHIVKDSTIIVPKRDASAS